MTLTVLLKDEKKYIFYGVREYCIEYGKYLKFTYVGDKDAWRFRNEKEVHEGFFILDAISGYYINR